MSRTKPPGHGDPHIFELGRTLQEFAVSPRYEFMKGLQVGRFLETAGHPAQKSEVQDATFERLIELGPKKLTKLKWLTAPQTKVLIGVLKNFVGQSESLESAIDPSKVENEDPNEIAPANESEEYAISSVEAERHYREIVAEVKAHPRFESLSKTPLGAFWRLEWTRAPFEESMTISQFVSLDPAMLMKKRTVTNQRIMLIVGALKRALAQLQEEDRQVDEDKNSVSERPAPILRSVPTRQPLKAEPLKWSLHLDALQPSLALALMQFEREVIEIPSTHDRLIGAFHQIFNVVSAQEFSQVLVASENTFWDKDQAFDSKQSGTIASRLLMGLRETHADVMELLKGSLSAPAVHRDTLVAPLVAKGLSFSSALLGIAALALLFGAKPASAFGKSLPEHWTISPGALEILLGSVLKELPKTEDQTFKLLETLVPGCEVRLLLDLMNSKIKLNSGRYKRLR